MEHDEYSREGAGGMESGRAMVCGACLLPYRIVGFDGSGVCVKYQAAVKSTQALTLLGAAVLGQGAAYWEGRRKKEECRKGAAESRKQKTESRNGAGGTALALIILLAGAAVWQGETGHVFQYRGQGRWSGPWDNPNTFGMLMGVGVVLAVGTAGRKA